MTKREFFQVLSRIKNKYQWKLDQCPISPISHVLTIRGFKKEQEYCPITAVCKEVKNKKINMNNALDKGRELLNLKKQTAENIVWAADGCALSIRVKAEYRRKLIKTLGLQEIK